jgi:hypothetical protein
VLEIWHFGRLLDLPIPNETIDSVKDILEILLRLERMLWRFDIEIDKSF